MYLPLLLTTVLKSSECIQILESWANLVVSETSAIGYATFYFATPKKHYIPVSSSSSVGLFHSAIYPLLTVTVEARQRVFRNRVGLC